jgi:hypothetical protein
MLGFQTGNRDEGNRDLHEIIDAAKLDHPIEKSKFDQLATIRNRFQSIQADLIKQFHTGKLPPEEYLTRFNAALRETMKRNEEVLGREEFISIFGHAGQAPDGLIDPEVFFAETRKEPPKLRAR